MSSDCFLDVAPSGDELGTREALRVGHLVLMAGLEPNLVAALDVLVGARPVLDEPLIGVIGDSFDYMRRSLEALRRKDPMWLAMVFGSSAVFVDDGEDLTVLPGARVVAFLRQYVGAFWRLRVD